MGEQNYQRYREERFRQTSESTNQRVSMVGPRSDRDPVGDGRVANETSQEFFRGQEVGLVNVLVQFRVLHLVGRMVLPIPGLVILNFVRNSNFVNCVRCARKK